MNIRAGFRKVFEFFTTSPDNAPSTASLIDSVDYERREIVLRGLEAGPGVQIDIVDSDMVPGTPWKRVRISSTAGGGTARQRQAEAVVWSGGPVVSGTVTIPNVFAAAAPSPVYARDVDVYLNGIRLYWDKDDTIAGSNAYDVSSYDLVLSIDNIGYALQNGDVVQAVFSWM